MNVVEVEDFELLAKPLWRVLVAANKARKLRSRTRDVIWETPGCYGTPHPDTEGGCNAAHLNKRGETG